MNIFSTIKKNKYCCFAILFAFLNMLAVFSFFGFQKHDDTPSYTAVIHWLQGEEIQVSPWRILTPLGPLIALPFEFLGEGAGLIIQNIFFYFFSAYLIFRIIELVSYNRKQAFLGTILFITALPILRCGLSYLTDMGAWFFSSLSLYLTLLYLKHKNEKLILVNGLLSGIGVLAKLNGGLGILFFTMMILLVKEFNLREKFFKILKFGVIFLLPIAIIEIYTFAVFHYTSLGGYFSMRTEYSVQYYRTQPGSSYVHLGRFATIIYAYTGEFLKSFGIIGLFFSLIGLWREWLQKNKERIRIYLALVPFSLSFLIYPPTDSRFAFLAAPLLILLATYGLIYLKNIFSERKGKLVIFILIVGHIVFNYYFHTVGSYRLILLKLIEFIR